MSLETKTSPSTCSENCPAKGAFPTSVLLMPLSWQYFFASSKFTNPAVSPSSKSYIISEPLPYVTFRTSFISGFEIYVAVTSTPLIDSSFVATRVLPFKVAAFSSDSVNE